jgi:hypothetical protein
MKKFAIIALLLAAALPVFAQNLDGAVKTAVDGLAARLIHPLEVSVGDINLAGTETPSGLSLHLSNRIAAHAPNHPMFRVVSPSRGISRVRVNPDKALIKGVFIQEGKQVRITLQLVNEAGGSILAASDFTFPLSELEKLGIALLPENVNSVEEIKSKEAVITPPAPPTPPPSSAPASPRPSDPQPLTITAWPNSDTRTDFEGDTMTVQLVASRDCFVKVYHIDTRGKLTLLFPNRYNRDNFLRAGTEYTIPQRPVSIVVEPPFGMESVWVQASGKPFANVEAEFAEIKNAGREAIEAARMVRLEANFTEGYAEARFNITTLSDSYGNAD